MHSNLSDEVNRNIAQSEIEGGVWLNKLAVGAVLSIHTENTAYTLEKRGDTDYYLSGNLKYCPVATKVHINGSTFGGSMIKLGFIGRGMYMEFYIVMPEADRKRGQVDGHGRIITSQIQSIEEVLAVPPASLPGGTYKL
jgi:hypothetical protein